MKLTRDEVVTMAQAVEEFRDEFSGSHLDENRAFAERLSSVLRVSLGDAFELRAVDEVDV